jgi:general secretion pathway protein C
MAWNSLTNKSLHEFNDVEVTTRPQLSSEVEKQHVTTPSGAQGYGESRQSSTVLPSSATDNVSEKRLGLVLRGVVSSDSQQSASAIIENQQGQTELYVIGDILPGNAELREIQENHVVVIYDGVNETLWLQGGDIGSPDDELADNAKTTTAQPTAISNKRPK